MSRATTAQKYRKQTMRMIVKHLRASYLGFRLTPAQIKSGARRLYEMHLKLPTPSRFFWENNAINTPSEDERCSTQS